jgi:glycosyltransferase involved in cell wall biosynthesis
LGTFAKWKGHHILLRALARVPRDVLLRTYIIGDAVYETTGSQHTRQALMDQVHHFGLGDRVVFTGAVDRPDAALRALDIVVHASTEPEPFGLVIAEAMACERPTIVSLAGGAAEIVSDGVDALGHVPGDVAGLTSRIVELASDPGHRRRIACAARLTAERRFDRARLADELVPLYREIARPSAYSPW